MTEKFVCPEPFRVPADLVVSREEHSGAFVYESLVRVSDLPALCKAEVERALKAKNARLQECGYLPRGFDLSPQDDDYLSARFPEAAPEPTASCCHATYVEGCAHCAYLRPHIDRLTPQPSAEPQCTHEWVRDGQGHPVNCGKCGVTRAGIDLKKFRMSEKGWMCRVCREEIVSPAHPMFHKCPSLTTGSTSGAALAMDGVFTPSAGERNYVYAVSSGYVMRDTDGSLWLNPDGAIEFAARLDRTEIEACGLNWPNGILLAVPTPTEGERKPGIAELSKPPFVPTPSAGETKCRVCNGAGWRTGEVVLLGGPHRTTDRCPECDGTGIESAVGARPEATPLHEALGLPHNPLTPCTACACERCKAREAFVRALAEERCSEKVKVGNSYPVLAAARKVVR